MLNLQYFIIPPFSNRKLFNIEHNLFVKKVKLEFWLFIKITFEKLLDINQSSFKKISLYA